MSIAKEEARKVLDTIPDDASWDEIMYEFYLRQKVELSIEEADRGRVVSQEEVEERYAAE